MTSDPMGLGAASKTSPKSLNRYSYVNGNPVNFRDPGGTCFYYWSQVSETYGYWDSMFCYDERRMEQPEVPSDTPNGGGGEPEPGEMWVDRAKKVAKNIKEKIFNSKNPCSDFFGENAANALDNLVNRLTQKPDFAGGQTSNTGISQTYKYPLTFVPNADGQKLYRVPDIAVIIANGPFTSTGKIGFGSYGPGTGGTQIIALLHEIAHNIIIPGGDGSKFLIPNDGGNTKLSEENTKLILEKCADQIFKAIGGL